MHKPEIIRKAISLYKKGKNKSQISRELSVPASTVRSWINRPGPVIQLVEVIDSKSIKCEFESHQGHQDIYAYILGLYLGDGHIVKCKRTYCLRIYQNSKKVNLIDECKKCLEKLFLNNIVGIYKRKGKDCTIIYVYNKNIPNIFPQHGPGRKHTRKISLTNWQNNIVKKSTIYFIKGLLDSDGCRYIDKDRVYYTFSNKSEDIKSLFCKACDMLDIKYTKKVGYKNINIRQKSSIDKLEKLLKNPTLDINERKYEYNEERILSRANM